MNSVLTYKLRRLGISKPSTVAVVFARLRRLGDRVEASFNFLADLVKTTPKMLRRALEILIQIGWVSVEREGSFTLKKPKTYRINDAMQRRVLPGAHSRAVSRALSSSQTITKPGTHHTIMTNTLLSSKVDDAMTLSEDVVVSSSLKSVKSVSERSAPQKKSEASEIEAVVVGWERKAGRSADEVNLAIRRLRRMPEDRVRYVVQSLELKLLRGKPIRNLLGLFWSLLYRGGRGEKGADANRTEHLEAMRREAENASRTLQPKTTPREAEPVSVAVVLTQVKVLPTPPLRRDDIERLRENERRGAERDRLLVPPETPSVVLVAPVALRPPTDEDQKEARKAHEREMMARCEQELRDHARGGW